MGSPISRIRWMGALGAAVLVAATTCAASATGSTSERQAVRKKAIALSVNGHESCVVTAKHAAKCWGQNADGELGNNSTTDSSTPVGVVGLRRGVKAVSVGENFACALTMKGAVKCWGANQVGQLGNNTTTSSSTPVQVTGLRKGVKTISAGSGFACALTRAGRAKCWGLNSDGQLGDNTTTNRLIPVAVSNLGSRVKSISAGGLHACAVNSSSRVKCWGSNVSGGLGDGTTTNSTHPVAVHGLGKVLQVSAGYGFTCATTRHHTPYCWGANANGALGNGTTTGTSLVPVRVLGLAGRTLVVRSGLYFHTCAVTVRKRAKCWGTGSSGELGNNTTTSSPSPVSVLRLTHVAGIGVGIFHSCARTMAGAVYCWGLNTVGQLGNGNTTSALVPVRVTGF